MPTDDPVKVGVFFTGQKLFLDYRRNETIFLGTRPRVRSGLHPITTAPLEGLNNKIKVPKRKAYGYGDAAFFALRLLIYEPRMELVGC